MNYMNSLIGHDMNMCEANLNFPLRTRGNAKLNKVRNI